MFGLYSGQPSSDFKVSWVKLKGYRLFRVKPLFWWSLFGPFAGAALLTCWRYPLPGVAVGGSALLLLTTLGLGLVGWLSALHAQRPLPFGLRWFRSISRYAH